MHIYTVHVKTAEDGSLADVQFVREGFNIFAFLFLFFWALYQRAWLMAAIFFIIQASLQLVKDAGYLSEFSLAICQIGLSVAAGFIGPDGVRHALKSRGYRMVDVVASDSLVRAEQRFLDRYLPANAV